MPVTPRWLRSIILAIAAVLYFAVLLAVLLGLFVGIQWRVLVPLQKPGAALEHYWTGRQSVNILTDWPSSYSLIPRRSPGVFQFSFPRH